MCGRYELDKPEGIHDRFATINDIDFAPNDDVRPSQTLPVIVNTEHKTIELMRWGLIPFWAKEAKIGYKMVTTQKDSPLAK